MNTIANLLTSLILAIWVGAIAILSVQNFSSVSLKFLIFQSVEIPAGLVLAFSAGAGMLGGAIAPILWRLDAFQQQVQLDDLDEED